MPAQPSNSFPSKRPRTEAPAKKSIKFTSVADIRSNLHIQNDTLVEAITGLRNQLTVWPTEPSIPPNDERLLLVQRWIESSPGATEVFEIWDGAGPRQTSLIAVSLSLLSSVLTLLSSHYTFHALGQPIVKALLTPTYLRRLNSYVGGSNNELIIVTLKLLNVMASFAGGRERKVVLEGFAWEIKSLPKLLNMRRKTKNEETPDPLIKPDIRTLYILFLLSFVDAGTPSQIKSSFISQHRDAFLAIFKSLNQDHSSLIRKILEVSWAGIWSDPKVKRTLKIGLFSEQTVAHLLKLYDHVTSDTQDADYVPADLVHHFLLAICTHPGVGICFKDRGWYPREAEGDSDLSGPKDDPDAQNQKGGKMYNKILANILKTLKVNEDARQQELAIKIMSACPELVAGYWAGAALTLEPRLSSKWITNVSFFGVVISLPVPTSSFFLPNTHQYNPTPPPLTTILENILPSSINTKSHFSKGLQSTSGLVQHCTALALAKCLQKYESVLRVFEEAQEVLEEDLEEGQWVRRRREVEREVRRRVPEVGVVVGFAQQGKGRGNEVRGALLAESAQRLLWMYHRCLPAVVAEARFDVGKLLLNFSVRSGDEKEKEDGMEVEGEEGKDDGEEPGAAVRLHRVQQLHVLKILKESDQFVWAGKAGSAPHTNLYILLKSLTTLTTPLLRNALSSLLQHLLSQSILFQSDTSEPSLWLSCIPHTRRSPGAESPDGTPLKDEGEVVIKFLDECVQRCLKTPYRYIEDMYTLFTTTPREIPDRLDACPSPLLLTVLEQLDAKVGNKSLSPSGTLALASFIRKLVFRLTSKTVDLQAFRVVVDKVDVVLGPERLWDGSGDEVVRGAVRREVGLMSRCLGVPPKHAFGMESEGEGVDAFLGQVEGMQIPTSKSQRINAASELIDWLRLVNQPLSPSQVRQLANQISKFHAPAIQDLVEYLDPEQSNIWDGLEVISNFQAHLDFAWLFLHAREYEIMDENCRVVLSDSAFTQTTSLVDIMRVVRLIMHRLSTQQQSESEGVVTGLLLVLARIVRRSKAVLSPGEFTSLKAMVFEHQGVLKEMFMAGGPAEGTRQFLEASLVGISETDRLLVSDIGRHWMDKLQLTLLKSDSSSFNVQFALLWVQYINPEELFTSLDTLASSIDGMASPSVLETVKHILHAILSTSQSESESHSEGFLTQRLPQLLSLRSILPDSETLESMVATAIEATIPIGLDGTFVNSGEVEVDVVSVVKRSKMRWTRRSVPLPSDFQIQPFLTQETWTEATVKIVRGWLYKCPSNPDSEAFTSWLGSQECLRRSDEQLVPVVHAWLDTTRSRGSDLSGFDGEVSKRLFARLVGVVLDGEASTVLRAQAEIAACQLVSLTPSGHSEALLRRLTTTLESKPLTTETPEFLSLIAGIHKIAGQDAKAVVSNVVDRGMQWAIRQFSEGEEDEGAVRVVEELIQLVELTSVSKPNTVETLLGVIIQNRLSSPSAIKLAEAALRTASLKPLIVNRLLQSTVQHPHFFKFCSLPSSARDGIISLLYTLFHLHPTNTCQVTHIEPLVRVYRGKLSSADLKVLSIFQLFETTRKLSVSQLFGRWSAVGNGEESGKALDAVLSLDAGVVLRTCLNFPWWRRLEFDTKPLLRRTSGGDEGLYDPVFLILLFGHMLAESPPTSAISWIEMFRTNIVSLILRALASKYAGMREVAILQIVALYKHMATADLQEKPHILHILTLLKNTFPAPSSSSSNEPCPRLPTYTALLLTHALRALFHPFHFTYPLIARFLLQRPELDTGDVPLLYGMLYSSESEGWKKERAWIIRMLADGMVGTGDWRVLRRRHAWDLLASLWQGEEDAGTKLGILEVLANLTCNLQAVMSLILKSALLSWIEMQLLLGTKERVEWFKILENILVFVDSKKLEAALGSEWRAMICRCLLKLLDNKTSYADLPLVVPVILRLSSLEGREIHEFPELLERAVGCLETFEEKTKLEVTPLSSPKHSAITPQPPHLAQSLHSPSSLSDPLSAWGSCVEMLWRAALSDKRTSKVVWDALTSRAVLWRGLVGRRAGSEVGEWVRVECIRNLAD